MYFTFICFRAHNNNQNSLSQILASWPFLSNQKIKGNWKNNIWRCIRFHHQQREETCNQLICEPYFPVYLLTYIDMWLYAQNLMQLSWASDSVLFYFYKITSMFHCCKKKLIVTLLKRLVLKILKKNSDNTILLHCVHWPRRLKRNVTSSRGMAIPSNQNHSRGASVNWYQQVYTTCKRRRY